MVKGLTRTLIIDTPKKIGEEVLLAGWVNIVRDHGKITFVDLLDQTGVVQAVFTPEVFFDHLHPQDVINIIGKVKLRPEKLVNPNMATGKIEIEASEITLLSKAEELPFDMGVNKLDLQLPTLFDYRTLTLRHSEIKNIFLVQEAIVEGFRQAAKKLSCTEIFTPTISASATEGGAEVFMVDYYGHKAFLTQSPQLYKQMMVPVYERVYTIAHAYRAEPSITTRHLSEAIQLDCEIGFIDFNDLLDALEFVGQSVLKHVEATCHQILEDYHVSPFEINKDVPRLKMREAQEIIYKRTGVDHTKEKDLMPEDEKEIGLWAREERGSDLVTITHYPTQKRAFYTMPDPEDPEYSLSYDLIFCGLEILSGSQRINDYANLVQAMKDRGLNPTDFEMYLQAFKYGMPSEGGFSFGLERLTMQILGLGNIREASLFPRDMERVDVRLSTIKSKK